MSDRNRYLDHKEMYVRHSVGGALLWIILFGVLGSVYLWARTRESNEEALKSALNSVNDLKQELSEVTSDVDAQIINMGLEARMVTNDKGIIELCSPTAAAVCGYDPQELLGKSATVLVPPDMRNRHTNGINAAFANKSIGKVQIVQCQLLKKDGSTRPVEVIVRMVEDSSGRRAVVTITPIEKIQFTPGSATYQRLPELYHWNSIS